MPEKYFITAIAGVKVRAVLEEGSQIIIKGSARLEPDLKCPRCEQSQYRTKATVRRTLKHAIYQKKLVLLRLRIPKLFCRVCRHYFLVRVPGVLPRRRSTENFRSEVFEHHHGGHSGTHIARTHRISGSTVERWYQDFVRYRVQELKGRACPIVMGIDEHFFSKKLGFATTIADLKNHKVFDVIPGRSELSLESYLRKLPGRERVRIIVMDLSETYRAIARKYFPNALIVTDRFHVVRLLNYHFLKTWALFDPEGRKNRGLSSLMRRHAWNLKPEQLLNLEEYFRGFPGLREIWDFKQGLCELLIQKNRNKEQVKQLIPQFLWHLNELLESPLPNMKAFGQTLKSWSEGVVRMWRFSKNNGITEGLHTKMEMISRRAFGFRNFENYRLRVIALCGWNGVLARRN